MMEKQHKRPASFRFLRFLVLVIVLILAYAATFHSTVNDPTSRMLPPDVGTKITDEDTTAWNASNGSLELKAPGTLRGEESHNFRFKEGNIDDRREVIWSKARTDRSGSAIQDMLMCHAYAFENNMTYGGACARDKSMNEKRKESHEALIQGVGLDGVLNFQCPQDESTNLTDRHTYYAKDTQIFTPAYIQYLQTLLAYPTKSNATRQIAVHVRRGDITPCRPLTTGYQRYLPNQHYLNLIDHYNPQNDSRVVIYSESNSFESLDEFRERGYDISVDSDIVEVWKGMLNSDVLIISRSSFSLVPAIMHRGTVVYTPFWHKPLNHWDIVNDSLVNQSTAEFYRVRATCPEPAVEKRERRTRRR